VAARDRTPTSFNQIGLSRIRSAGSDQRSGDNCDLHLVGSGHGHSFCSRRRSTPPYWSTPNARQMPVSVRSCRRNS